MSLSYSVRFVLFKKLLYEQIRSVLYCWRRSYQAPLLATPLPSSIANSKGGWRVGVVCERTQLSLIYGAEINSCSTGVPVANVFRCCKNPRQLGVAAYKNRIWFPLISRHVLSNRNRHNNLMFIYDFGSMSCFWLTSTNSLSSFCFQSQLRTVSEFYHQVERSLESSFLRSCCWFLNRHLPDLSNTQR